MKENKCSSLRSGTKQEVCFHHFYATLSRGSGQVSSLKRKKTLFTDNMITYIENLMTSTKRLLKLISSLARLQDTYMINIKLIMYQTIGS